MTATGRGHRPTASLVSGGRGPSPSRQQLGGEAESYIRDLIVSGQLRGGDFIRPETVAQELGISSTPVREGLFSLRTQGFVRLEPRRGFMVVALTGDDIRDLFAAQALLAGELAARAVKNSDAADVARLEALHVQLEEAADSGAQDELEHFNYQFHRAINHLAGAPKIAWLLGVSLSYVPIRFYSSIEGWPSASVHDHRALLDAFRRRAAKAARTAMTEHVVHAGELLAVHVESGAARREQPSTS